MNPFLLKELDIDCNPVSLFERLAHLPGSILLDSGMVMEGLSRYSFLAADPFLIFTSRGTRVEIEKKWGMETGFTEIREGNPLDILRELLHRYQMDPVVPFPFWGGAAGYFAYDLGRQLENLPQTAIDDTGVFDCWLGFYDVVAVMDHVEKKVTIASTGQPAEGMAEKKQRSLQRLKWLEKILIRQEPCSRVADTNETFVPGTQKKPELVSVFEPESYCEIVQKAKNYIAAGDIFQVNLSQRFCLPQQENSWQIYKKLRSINPAPMAAYINCGRLQVVSASPERFLKVSKGGVETRPIKGTRPRGSNPAEDQHWREELWNSEKDRAELVMIVDLERNDLGRVCIPGSVQVPELYRLEQYPTVFHLVATVTGKIEAGKDTIDLLKASFPGGSITGAPKIRAMEIIEELEPVRRGIYCGSIGYLAFNGDADLNIVIRTLVFTGQKIFFQVGGGITIDSDPRSEYLETLDKAKALVRALGLDFGHRG